MDLEYVQENFSESPPGSASTSQRATNVSWRRAPTTTDSYPGLHTGATVTHNYIIYTVIAHVSVFIQVCNTCICRFFTTVGVTYKKTDIGLSIIIVLTLQVGTSLAVSYTHLDVYKRQLVYSLKFV